MHTRTASISKGIGENHRIDETYEMYRKSIIISHLAKTIVRLTQEIGILNEKGQPDSGRPDHTDDKRIEADYPTQ